MTSLFTVFMTIHLFSVAVPFIRRVLVLGADTASRLLIAYALLFMACMLLYGKLADIVGQKRLLTLEMLLFLLESSLIMSSHSFSGLLLARMLQGIGDSNVNHLSISKYSFSRNRGKSLQHGIP